MRSDTDGHGYTVDGRRLGLSNLLFEDEVFLIRGAVFEVHNHMGSGFLEAVYQECLEGEFTDRNIAYVARPKLNLNYKVRRLKQIYRSDFICFGKIILELKAVTSITVEHRAQLLNYLKGTGLRLGLLINFGQSAKVQIERIVL